MTTQRFLFFLPLFFHLLPSTSFSQSLVEDLAIEIKGNSREFAFTNKETAFLYGETNAENKTSWQGFNVFGHEFLDDYEIWAGEKKLERKSVLKTIVYPDYLKRVYPNGIVEELRVVDSLPLFSVTITSTKAIHIDVIPFFSDGRISDDYEIHSDQETAVLARKNHLAKTERENYPVWLAIHGTGFLPQIKPTKRGGQFSPLRLISRTATKHTVVFAVADKGEEAETIAKHYLRNEESFHSARRSRMEKLLRDTYVETDNKRFNKALAWAKLSLDALMMNQVTRGIFAGLPWFNNYWGRDTFISLPGATLVQGRFTEAKQILQSFAAYQQLDTNSTDYGRIPNIVTTTDKAYNTADGTPRFVMTAREYIERSGDTTFLADVYPTIVRSIEGTLKYHCDSLGFLTHGDQETWMDAAGPDGCWSPRGNRANDIQALWAQQLEAGIWFASKSGVLSAAQKWTVQLEKLKRNFLYHFVVDGKVTDHLNVDGSVDRQLRPNQIFASTLLSETERASVLNAVVRKLTYGYGVASLSQEDEIFHPYHQNEPYYPKDAAYHNGTVWTWVQGPVISELCHFGKQELGWKITENSIHQILDRGGVGTQSELIDAIPRPNEPEPRLSGTFSQAWNLAEFIRNFYDDYLGVRVSLLNHHLVLRPKLPASIGSVKATINLNGRALPIEVHQTGGTSTVTIDGANLRKGGSADVTFDFGSKRMETKFNVPPKSTMRFQMMDSVVTLLINSVKTNEFITSQANNFTSHLLDSLHLADPELRVGLRSLKGPDHPLLSHKQVKQTNAKASRLVEAGDPTGDDVGTGAFTYPSNTGFVNGAFDITALDISSDKKSLYFKLKFASLSNPGWHPEYGFQLTYVAIAIDQDGIKGSGRRTVDHNSNYVLNEEHGFEKLILVGGGVRLEDNKGKTLVAYIPTPSDVSNPLGNADNGTIIFALPISFVGLPTKNWTFTVLAGAQDDHGGAGIGEFRTVNKIAGEWNGGGKANTSDPNVYDILIARPK